jgi:hypothetical protein
MVNYKALLGPFECSTMNRFLVFSISLACFVAAPVIPASAKPDISVSSIASSSSSEPLALIHASVIAGGVNSNGVTAIRTDASGNIYVVGNSSYRNFKAPAPGYGTDESPGSYVIKYNAELKPVYTVIIPGSHAQTAVVDASGSVYIAGYTTDYLDFPSTPGAYLTAGINFITKINPSGTALVYSTGIGSYGDMTPYSLTSIAVDSAGDCYFVASTAATTALPVTPDAIQKTYGGGDSDGVIGELNAQGSALLYMSFLGGSGNDTATALYLDKDTSSLYVTGTTSSANFPVTTGSYNGDPTDAFVTKMDLSPKSVAYSRYLGGSKGENAFAITGAGGNSNDVYVAGDTASSDFPVSPNAYQTGIGGRASAYLTKLGPSGNVIDSTLLGGPGFSAGFTQIDALAVDSQGDIFASGFSSSYQLPFSNGAVQDFNVSTAMSLLDLGPTGFITEFTPDLSQTQFGTFYGGLATAAFDPPETAIDGLWVGTNDYLYAIGNTNTTDAPLIHYDPSNPAFNDGMFENGFWLTFAHSPVYITTPTRLPLAIFTKTYKAALQAKGGIPPYTWSPVAGTLPTGVSMASDGTLSGGLNPEYNGSIYGSRLFTVKVTDSEGNSAIKGMDMIFDYPISVSSPSVTNVKTGQPLHVIFSFNGGEGKMTCVLGKNNLPSGVRLVFDSPTPECILEGMPSQSGTYNYQLKFEDALGQIVITPAYQLTVKDHTKNSTHPSGGGGGSMSIWGLVLLFSFAMFAFKRPKLL